MKHKTWIKWLTSEINHFGWYEWPGEHCDYAESYITFVKIYKSGRHFFLFTFRIRVALLERPGVLSIQFGKIISEIPNRLPH